MGYCGRGVAQEELLVDTPDHKWYAVLPDRGAVGRIPVLVPVKWEKNVRVTYMPAPGEQKEQIIKRKLSWYWVIREGHSVKWKQKAQDRRNSIIRLWRVMIFQNGIRTRNGCLERLMEELLAVQSRTGTFLD